MKQANLSQRLSQSDVATLMRQMMWRIEDGICIIDENFNIVESNQTFADMLGYSYEELMTLHIWDWEANFTEQDIRQMFPDFAELQTTFQTLHRRKDGSEYIANITAGGTAFKGESYAFCIVKDVTKHAIVERELIELRQAVDQANDCVFMFDPETLLFTYTNQGAEKQVGYSSEELSRMTPVDIKPNFTEPQFRELVQYMFEHQMYVHRFETVHRHKDGHDVDVSINLQLIRSQQGRDKFIAIVRDITEEKRLQRELVEHRDNLAKLVDEKTYDLKLAKEKAEAANLAKTLFLANMSHEIRTPINAINGYATLLNEGKIDQSERHYVDKIKIASMHLLDMLSSVLDLSKIESNAFELKHEPLSVRELLSGTSAIIGDSAAQKGIEVEIDVGFEEDRFIGDKASLQQALLNYASNAVKFTEQGKIIIRASMLERSTKTTLLQFEVIDTGIGIEQPQLETLFEAFEQLDNSFTRAHSGAGLGLAISRKLARLNGGDAGASSIPGEGSTFWFTCRLELDTTSLHSEQSLSPSDILAALNSELRGHNILIVDDEPANAEILATFLADMAGQNVTTVNNGELAVNAAQNQSFDLILMDIQMPVMDGVTAARHIRNIQSSSSPPIVALTGNAFFESELGDDDVLFTSVITKPFHADDIFAVTHKVLLQLEAI
ncbi:PAS domain-containing hybrid sensor histidine kinase/response regulator [Alteromonas facilis]|uniref:PAS domain-containing hybrid sensor histidine kinase/response regulator n=1 Tax=Alteromonas facilis TaxID=2048004 RepID=UPI000C288B65|nr:PAS domain S-box protein [Alteromonas facilis]